MTVTEQFSGFILYYYRKWFVFLSESVELGQHIAFPSLADPSERRIPIS